MFMFMKSSMCKISRVDDEHHHHHHHHKVEDKKKENTSSSCKSLTVWRKSLLFSCQGFTVIGSDGNLAYRVESYIKHPNEIILMDGSGKPILTICRHKKLVGLSESWFIYEGEPKHSSSSTLSSSNKPLCHVRKHHNILLQNNLNILAYIYLGVSDKRHTYIIEGSYSNRSCKILDEKRRVVAEIKKKQDITKGVSYGSEVFVLIVSPGFDCGLAMAIILLLDQMFS
ncbi:hypothetical protein Leryth_016164 [Lithospermum erythrorhizon]|uniref:Protein LURP-one-related 17 n=1 Tax=Lithospermum erythrorhizon TaxID=34254 RepID=A0AAV3R2U7_LITER|nr:hypothetical protein Leryth_016164 [Lithospermum erythrorhizon]